MIDVMLNEADEMSELPVSAEVMLYQGIRDILLAARIQARQTVNTTMVQAYWQVGRLIVEGEQGGEKRAEYGKGVLAELSRRLSAKEDITTLRCQTTYQVLLTLGYTLTIAIK